MLSASNSRKNLILINCSYKIILQSYQLHIITLIKVFEIKVFEFCNYYLRSHKFSIT